MMNNVISKLHSRYMNNMHSKNIINDMKWLISFLVLLWLTYFVSLAVPDEIIMKFGLLPRHLDGIFGIFSMNFIHADFTHIKSNTLMLFLISSVLCLTRTKIFMNALIIAIISGVALWLLGDLKYHLGISMLVFGLASYAISSGFIDLLIRKNKILFGASVLVLVLYGDVLLSGMSTNVPDHVSWFSHLLGFIVGILVSFQHIKHDNYRFKKRAL